MFNARAQRRERRRKQAITRSHFALLAPGFCKVTSMLLLLLLILPMLLYEQLATPRSRSDVDQDVEIGELERAASIAQDYVLDRNSRWTSNVPLKKMVEDHSEVAIVKLDECESRLQEGGAHINSDCNASVKQLLKGTVRGTVKFRINGGKVIFPNGTSATENTSEWKLLRNGREYLVVLDDRMDAPNLWPVNSCEGLFEIDAKNNTVDACAAHDRQLHRVVQDTEGMTSQKFLSRVKQIIAGERSQGAKAR